MKTRFLMPFMGSLSIFCIFTSCWVYAGSPAECSWALTGDKRYAISTYRSPSLRERLTELNIDPSVPERELFWRVRKALYERLHIVYRDHETFKKVGDKDIRFFESIGGSWTQGILQNPSSLRFRGGRIDFLSDSKIVVTLPAGRLVEGLELLIGAAEKEGAFALKFASGPRSIQNSESVVLYFAVQKWPSGELEAAANRLGQLLLDHGIHPASSPSYFKTANGLGLGVDGRIGWRTAAKYDIESSDASFTQTTLVATALRMVALRCQPNSYKCAANVLRDFRLRPDLSFIF